MENRYYTGFAIAFIQSGGVQKLGGAVFCKAGTGEKLTINIVSNQWRIGISHSAFFPDD